MQIEEIKTEEIKPYSRNPRKNDAAVDAVAKSIQEFGFKIPIVIDMRPHEMESGQEAGNGERSVHSS